MQFNATMHTPPSESSFLPSSWRFQFSIVPLKFAKLLSVGDKVERLQPEMNRAWWQFPYFYLSSPPSQWKMIFQQYSLVAKSTNLNNFFRGGRQNVSFLKREEQEIKKNGKNIGTVSEIYVSWRRRTKTLKEEFGAHLKRSLATSKQRAEIKKNNRRESFFIRNPF